MLNYLPVVYFFNDINLEPLRGNKKIQYIDWLNNIKNKNRYKDLNNIIALQWDPLGL